MGSVLKLRTEMAHLIWSTTDCRFGCVLHKVQAGRAADTQPLFACVQARQLRLLVLCEVFSMTVMVITTSVMVPNGSHGDQRG